ncbi:hypothetical protein HD553DRAFT_324776 [Filobasidium floriforme]|uniref:uncharacterized protein n=1 Tax=Filobasidium floriforme TaxID=5210 RepID=UPI001E8D3359|nr:uncharacterized protein HD553DRAFT_324776 [Filobasidium floriforme]KAH8083228.1 hypothetical protein HD553DRAFT_324776 [Filobasidium floriforme]
MAPPHLVPSALSMPNSVPPGSSNDLPGVISSQGNSGLQGADSSRYTPASTPVPSTYDAYEEAGVFASEISEQTKLVADGLLLPEDAEGLTPAELKLYKEGLKSKGWIFVRREPDQKRSEDGCVTETWSSGNTLIWLMCVVTLAGTNCYFAYQNDKKGRELAALKMKHEAAMRYIGALLQPRSTQNRAQNDEAVDELVDAVRAPPAVHDPASGPAVSGSNHPPGSPVRQPEADGGDPFADPPHAHVARLPKRRRSWFAKFLSLARKRKWHAGLGVSIGLGSDDPTDLRLSNHYCRVLPQLLPAQSLSDSMPTTLEHSTPTSLAEWAGFIEIDTDDSYGSYSLDPIYTPRNHSDSWQSSAPGDPGIEDTLTEAVTDDNAPISPLSEITLDDEQIETHRFNLELGKGDLSERIKQKLQLPLDSPLTVIETDLHSISGGRKDASAARGLLNRSTQKTSGPDYKNPGTIAFLSYAGGIVAVCAVIYVCIGASHYGRKLRRSRGRRWPGARTMGSPHTASPAGQAPVIPVESIEMEAIKPVTDKGKARMIDQETAMLETPPASLAPTQCCSHHH